MGNWEKTLEKVRSSGPWWNKNCRVEGCEKEIFASFLCTTHYFRKRRYGTLFKPCGECGKEIEAGQHKYCKECKPIVTKRKQSEYKKRPEVREKSNASKRLKRKEPEEKIKRAKYAKEYMTRPEAKELKKIRDAKYRQQRRVQRLMEESPEFRKIIDGL